MKQRGIAWFGFSPTFWLAVGALAAAFASGWWVARQFYRADLVAQVNEARAREQAQFRLVVRTETVVQERIRVVRERGKEIVREVPKIVHVEVEKACPAGLPGGFVRVHDAAARGEPAGAPSESDARPAGVTLAQAAETIADNYTEYHACREQVRGWQRFYQSLREAHGGQRH